MTNVSIEDLDIQFVSQEHVNWGSIELSFSANSFPYCLWIEKEKELLEPTLIFHDSNVQSCPYCGKLGGATVCETLTPHKDELFQTLIQAPSIRLEWLYLPHKEI